MSFLSNMKVFETELLAALDQISSNDPDYNRDSLKTSIEKLTNTMVNDNQTHTLQNGFVKKSIEKLETILENSSTEVPGYLLPFDSENNRFDVPLSNSYKTYAKVDVDHNADPDPVKPDPTINFVGDDIPVPKDGEFTTRKFTVEMKYFSNGNLWRPRFNKFLVNGALVNEYDISNNNNNNGANDNGVFNVMELNSGAAFSGGAGAWYQNFVLRRIPDGTYDVTSTIYYNHTLS